MTRLNDRRMSFFCAVAVALSVLPGRAANTVIGINFQGSQSGLYQGYPVTADADGIPVANWANLPDSNSGTSNVPLPTGGSLTVSWQCANTWTMETNAPAAGIGEVTHGYLDDGGVGYTVTISGLTNAGAYQLGLIASSDNATGFSDATLTWAGGSQTLSYWDTGAGGPLMSWSDWTPHWLTADTLTITGVGGGTSIRGTLAAVELVYDLIDNNSNLVIDGTTTNWQSADMILGYFGTNNSLHILNGGAVSNVSGFTLAETELAHDNWAVIEGTGSLLHAYRMYIGRLGFHNWIHILDGASVYRLDGFATIGSGIDACSNGVVIDGPGSQWQLSGLVVGDKGRHNAVIVTNGGTVYCVEACYVGANSTATGNEVLVTGSGSTFSCDPICVGLYSSSNRITVSDGGQLTTRGALRFGAGDTVGNEIVVEGSNSALHVAGDMNAMYDSSRHSQLTIRDGGWLDDTVGYFGWDATSVSNAALVTGPGSVWSNRGALFAGVAAEYTTLTISNGGAVYNQEGIVGSGSGAHNFATVIGTGSLWQCSRSFVVGNGGSSNALFVCNGGTVQSQGGALGNVGNRAGVTDPGSSWIMNGPLYVGGSESGSYGPGNWVTISNGGVVSATGAVIGQSDGNGILVGRNSLLRITNDTGTAELLLRGVLRFDGGTAVVDRILVRPYSSFVTNAWFGGRGTIAGGLLVETGNAVYVESGSQIGITGPVTNRSVIRGPETGSLDFYGPVVNEGYIEDVYGTVHFHSILQHVGIGILLDSNSARIASLSVSGSNTLIRFVSASNMPYSVSVASNLLDGAWQEEVGGLTGSGAMMTVTNVGAATAPRQYRKINLTMPDYVP